MAKLPPPPTYSKGFNLQDAFLSVIGSGVYDNVNVHNGNQSVSLTRFGGGASGSTPTAIHLQGNGQNLSVAPVTADAGSVTLGAAGKIDIQSKSALQSFTALPSGEKIAIVGGVAAVVVIGVALLALRR